MLYNYHTHTYRCNHATGNEKEFIEEAIKGGIKVLGFSDHAPMPFPSWHDSTFRMRMDELDDYCTTLLRLQSEYSKDIEIHIGLEAEYYPALFEDFIGFIKGYPIEYLLQGQHCLNNEYDGVGSGSPKTDPDFLYTYVRQTCEGMRTGKFLYLAHPDLCNYNYVPGEEKKYDDKGNRILTRDEYLAEMRKICRTAKETDMPLEINMLGLATGRNYPNPDFWKLVGEEGNRVVIGIDAHHVDMINLPETEEKAKKLAEDCGIKIFEGPLL